METRSSVNNGITMGWWWDNNLNVDYPHSGKRLQKSMEISTIRCIWNLTISLIIFSSHVKLPEGMEVGRYIRGTVQFKYVQVVLPWLGPRFWCFYLQPHNCSRWGFAVPRWVGGFTIWCVFICVPSTKDCIPLSKLIVYRSWTIHHLYPFEDQCRLFPRANHQHAILRMWTFFFSSSLRRSFAKSPHGFSMV